VVPIVAFSTTQIKCDVFNGHNGCDVFNGTETENGAKKPNQADSLKARQTFFTDHRPDDGGRKHL
jgi:hypothetical protein